MKEYKMKTLAALTLTAAVMFTATPAQANPATDALQQLANQLAELKVTIAQQARQAMEKTAGEVRQLLQVEAEVKPQKEVIAKADAKPSAE
jgi:outer membrane lipoprotein-sorting protein